MDVTFDAKKKVLTIGDDAFNLGDSLPLNIGEWNALEDLGISIEDLSRPKTKTLSTFACYVLRKARPDFKDELVVGMDFKTFMIVVDAINGVGAISRSKDSAETKASPS